MTRYISRTLMVASLLYLTSFPAQAALQRVGPTNPTWGYPSWYQDNSGLVMDFCTPSNASELSGGWCLLLPPVPSATPEIYPPPAANPDAFSPEHFYWATSVGGRHTGALLVMAVEGAFAAGPVVPGTQITFGRIRVVIPSLPVSGDYTIYHPFGVWNFPGLVGLDQGGLTKKATRLFFSEDVGFVCPAGQFDCALATSIGPFLIPSAAPGGAELPPIPLLLPGQDPFYDSLVAIGAAKAYPATGAKYLADPGRLGPVTGSPLPPFVSAVDGLTYNHNRFRVEVVPSVTATVPDINGVLITYTAGVRTVIDDSFDNFSVQGRVFEGAIPGNVSVDRASYTAPAAVAGTAKLDVYATATAGMQARVPPAPTAALLTAVPALQFWDSPCTLDAVTLLPIGPPAVGAPNQIFNDAARNKYWGQSVPTIVPLSVCVAQTNATLAGGGIGSIFYTKNVEDEVTVSLGVYDPTSVTLTVNAASSDAVTLPALNLLDYAPLVGGVYTGSMFPPPATLQVVSSAGGVALYQTNTNLGQALVSAVPVARNDIVTMFEDCSALSSAVPCATPLAINVIANDTVAGVPITFGPLVTVTLVSAPRLGTATVDPLTGNVLYTPNLNANGADGFSYTVAVIDSLGVAQNSNLAGVTVNITPVNDAPVAVADTAAALANTPVTINVLANDTDPDGATDIVGIVGLTQPVGPLGSISSAAIVGTAVSFTANTPGAYTFTYQAQDAGGGQGPTFALTSNVATVTVTVAGAETLIITPPANFIVASSRWKLAGTDLPAAGQTITLSYANGVNTGFIIGTAIVDGLGNWLFDVKGVTGLFNPTTAGATSLKATSSLGATAIAPITLK